MITEDQPSSAPETAIVSFLFLVVSLFVSIFFSAQSITIDSIDQFVIRGLVIAKLVLLIAQNILDTVSSCFLFCLQNRASKMILSAESR